MFASAFARQKFNLFDNANFRHSILTYKLSKSVLEKHESSLGDEKWDVMEQAFYACIDMGQNDLAETYVNRLSEQFPGLYYI